MKNFKQVWKKQFTVLLVMMFFGLLVACSSTDSGSSSTDSTSEKGETDKNEPLNLSWMSILYFQQTPQDTVLKKLEEMTNTKLDITWIPDAVKEDRLNTAIASTTLSQVVAIQDIQSGIYRGAVEDGLFWEIGPYLKDYKNLSQLNPVILENTSVNGKIYGIYRERPLSRQGIIYRRDWLENLGMEEPRTIDELYEMLRAFTYDDPDQNGKDDTYGLADRNDLVYGAFKTLSSYFGTPNTWEVKDGEMVPEFMTPEYVDTMKFMKKLMDEGLLNEDFGAAGKNEQQDKFLSGRAGVYIGSIQSSIYLQESIVNSNPDAKLDVISRIEGPEGDRVWGTGGHLGVLAFPKSSVKSEDELKRILAFFDRTLDEDVYKLMHYGIEGRHYKEENGQIVYIEDTQDLYDSEVLAISGGLTSAEMDYPRLGFNSELEEKVDTLIKDMEEIYVANPAEPLSSETFTERGLQLTNIISDATFNFILGLIDEAGFEKEVEKWRESGGDDIIKEYTEQYEKSKK